MKRSRISVCACTHRHTGDRSFRLITLSDFNVATAGTQPGTHSPPCTHVCIRTFCSMELRCARHLRFWLSSPVFHPSPFPDDHNVATVLVCWYLYNKPHWKKASRKGMFRRVWCFGRHMETQYHQPEGIQTMVSKRNLLGAEHPWSEHPKLKREPHLTP